MDINQKQKIQVIIGIIIIFLLLTICYMYVQDKQRDIEIINNCGFTQKEWSCVCTKDIVDIYQNKINLSDILFYENENNS